MKHSPIDELLEQALHQMAADLPDIKLKLDAFVSAAEHLEECDESGNLTRRAHDGRNRLRSPLLDMRPYRRAKSAVGKACRKSKFEAETAISTALVKYVKWRQHELEYDLLLDKDDASKEVPKSREATDRNDKFRITEKFIDELLDRNVTLSDFSRRRQFEYDLIASLLMWAKDDPKLENPENPWVKISAAGLLDAYRSGMTEDEARAIDLAEVLRDDRGIELLQAASEFLPKGLDVSPGFAASAARMLERGRALTNGEAQAYYDSFRFNMDKNIEALGEALGITDPDDLIKVRAANSFLLSADRSAPNDMPLWLKVTTVRAVIDNAEPASRAPADWVPEVTARLAQIAKAFSESVSNEDAFRAILRAGVETSVIGRLAERNSQERESLQAELINLRNLESLVMNGTSFKFSLNGRPIAETEPEFDDNSARIYRFVGEPRPIDDHLSEDVFDNEVADFPINNTDASPSQDRITSDVGLAQISSCDATDAEGDIYESHDLPVSIPHGIDVDGVDRGGGDSEAADSQADLFGENETPHPSDSDSVTSSERPRDLASNHLMNVDVEVDREGSHAPERAQILPTDAPSIEGLQMARRRAGNAESTRYSESPPTTPESSNPPSADRDRATDMDDEDF